jgi:hypothetical protein
MSIAPVTPSTAAKSALFGVGIQSIIHCSRVRRSTLRVSATNTLRDHAETVKDRDSAAWAIRACSRSLIRIWKRRIREGCGLNALGPIVDELLDASFKFLGIEAPAAQKPAKERPRLRRVA